METPVDTKKPPPSVVMEVEQRHQTTLAVSKMQVGLDVVLKLLATLLLLATTLILVPTFVKVQDHDVRIGGLETISRRRDAELAEIKVGQQRILDKLDDLILRTMGKPGGGK